MNKKIKAKCNSIIKRLHALGISELSEKDLKSELAKNKETSSFCTTLPSAMGYIEAHGVKIIQ